MLVNEISFNIFLDAINVIENNELLNVDSLMTIFKLRYYNLEFVYPSSDLNNIVTNIFLSNKRKYDKMVELLLNSNYNPIYNYSMNETLSATTDSINENTSNHSFNLNGTNTEKVTNTDDITNTSTNVNSTTTFENNNFNEKDKNTGTLSISKSNENSSNTTLSNNETGNNNSTSEYSSNNNHKLTREGNIGVTTTQKMINDELFLHTINNIYNTIINDVSNIILLKIWK